MAIFFLHQQKKATIEQGTLNDFNVVDANVRQWGNWQLWLGYTYKEEADLNFLEKDGLQAFMIGTPLYKNYNYKTVLSQVATDFLQDQLDLENLKGNFIFGFFYNNHITLLLDRSGQQSIFYHTTEKLLSSSFLLLVNEAKEKMTLHQTALAEKVAIGFNIGQDTIVNEIVKVYSQNVENLDLSGIDFIKNNIPQNLYFPKSETSKGKIDSVKNTLDEFFKMLNSSFTNLQGDLGMSGGFDCRLVLALAGKNLNKKLHIHSHATKGVHESELTLAKEIAACYGTDILMVPTKKMTEMSDPELQATLHKNLYFFDGRSARHLGAYSQTYTYDYKLASMGSAAYSLNGLGGEIYRDSYFIGNEKITWTDWSRRFLYLQLASEVLPKDTFADLDQNLKKKLSGILPYNLDQMDLVSTHGFYGFLKMPQCNGNLVSAYSKVSPFIAPFFEPSNVQEALKAAPYLGIGGQFQAKLITSIDSKLARIMSNYGSGFHKLSLKYLFWTYLKTWGSTRSRNKLVEKALLAKWQSTHHKKILHGFDSSVVLTTAKEQLLRFLPGLNIEKALLDSTQTRNIIFTAFLVNSIAHKIKNKDE